MLMHSSNVDGDLAAAVCRDEFPLRFSEVNADALVQLMARIFRDVPSRPTFAQLSSALHAVAISSVALCGELVGKAEPEALHASGQFKRAHV